jgi:hypothetical protein
MLLVLDFMPLDQISNMSQNGLRRQVATHDKAIIGPRMKKPLIKLDSVH